MAGETGNDKISRGPICHPPSSKQTQGDGGGGPARVLFELRRNGLVGLMLIFANIILGLDDLMKQDLGYASTGRNAEIRVTIVDELKSKKSFPTWLDYGVENRQALTCPGRFVVDNAD